MGNMKILIMGAGNVATFALEILSRMNLGEIIVGDININEKQAIKIIMLL